MKNVFDGLTSRFNTANKRIISLKIGAMWFSGILLTSHAGNSDLIPVQGTMVILFGASPVVQKIKNLSAIQET